MIKIIKYTAICLTLLLLVLGSIAYYLLFIPYIPPPELPGTFQHNTLLVEERHRTFNAYIPFDLPEQPAVIFVLHGSGQTGEIVRGLAHFEFDLLADQHKFILVYPEGLAKNWNDCRASADYYANKINLNENLFFQSMIDYMVENYNANRSKVFAAGYSNGGHMAYKLAYEMPDEFKAVASIAANLPVDSNSDCTKSNKPVSVAIFVGLDDDINPYEGGLVEVMGNTSRGSVMSAQDSAGYWKTLAGANTSATAYTFPELDNNKSTSVERLDWQNDKGINIRLYTLKGSGHVIPSKTARFPRMLGAEARDISGPQEIVDFFLAPNTTN